MYTTYVKLYFNALLLNRDIIEDFDYPIVWFLLHFFSSEEVINDRHV